MGVLGGGGGGGFWAAPETFCYWYLHVASKVYRKINIILAFSIFYSLFKNNKVF